MKDTVRVIQSDNGYVVKGEDADGKESRWWYYNCFENAIVKALGIQEKFGIKNVVVDLDVVDGVITKCKGCYKKSKNIETICGKG